MMEIHTGTFDPISQKELDHLRKNRTTTEIGLYVTKDGILPAAQRIKLLKAALKPYRHMHVLGISEQPCDIEPVDEEKVRSGCFRLAARGTRRILIREGYYFEQIVDAMCKPARAVHTRGVAATAVHLAKVHGLDEKQAWKAGMLHDITKRFSDEEGKRIIAIYQPEWLNISEKIWHSYTAVVWLKQKMGLHDQALLSAIEHHTLGDGKRPLDHILYIADKIEPGRGYDTARQMKLAEENLKEAAAFIKEESHRYIREKEGRDVSIIETGHRNAG